MKMRTMPRREILKAKVYVLPLNKAMTQAATIGIINARKKHINNNKPDILFTPFRYAANCLKHN